MRDLFRSSALLALRQLGAAALGVVRTKVIAVVLGPAGLGLVAQANQFGLVVGRVASLGLGAGVTRYTAQYVATGARRELQALLGGVRSTFLATGAALVVVAVLGRGLVANWIFGNSRYTVGVVAVGLAAPFLAQSDRAMFALRGARQFRPLALAGLAAALAGIAVVVPMVLVFGLLGAFWGILLAAAATCGIMELTLARTVTGPLGLADRLCLPDRALWGPLTAFGLVVLASGLSSLLAELVVRSWLLHRLGSEANGLYHVSWSVGSHFSAFLNTSLATWGLPTMAGLGGDPARVNRVRNDLLRALLLAGVPVAVAALIATRVWIPLLFSGAFLAAEPLLKWQLAAQLLMGARIMLNTSLWAHERFRAVLAVTLGQSAMYLGLALGLLGPLGVAAVPVAFLGSQLVTLVVTAAYLRRVESMRLDRLTGRLVATSAVVMAIWIAALAALPPIVARGVIVGVCVVWAALNVRGRDMRALWKELRRLPLVDAEVGA